MPDEVVAANADRLRESVMKNPDPIHRSNGWGVFIMPDGTARPSQLSRPPKGGVLFIPKSDQERQWLVDQAVGTSGFSEWYQAASGYGFGYAVREAQREAEAAKRRAQEGTP